MEPRAKREHHQERGGEKGKVPARSGAGHDAAQRIEPQVAGSDVRAGDADSRQDDRRQRDAVEELQHRQPEQVEGDVASEDRVDLAEGNRVCRVEPRRPRRGGEETEQPGNRQRRKVDDRAHAPGVDGDDARTVRRGDRELATPQLPERHPQVQPQDDEYGAADEQAGRRLRRQGLQEDLFVAKLLVPQPVGIELGERGDAREEQEGGEEERELGKAHGQC